MSSSIVASPIRSPRIEWDNESVKTVLKTALPIGAKIALDASGTCAKQASDHVCSDLPSEVKAAAIDVSTQQVSTCASKALDKSVDSCFATDSSWGSRIVNYFKS
ncbi:MAG: hypothetical protein KR126chlam4_00789 [Candidatus Anoxychlamydiales bacterium]|uniref:Uncharacterized protein n=1 Tax=marine sediment metagenome TaxID=412755 RepID=A0A0F9HU68_9ZZZZ|nr:hypothetical protein [Candidatus Anoxychlamydiales bacterium]NGX40958.1 hypothetical protein [Candidatus Anoxychlamydiales bacterium]HEU63852.1 hypothetical protein [Chlamydiota bacterium]